jgi:hypothetical protein
MRSGELSYIEEPGEAGDTLMWSGEPASAAVIPPFRAVIASLLAKNRAGSGRTRDAGIARDLGSEATKATRE